MPKHRRKKNQRKNKGNKNGGGGGNKGNKQEESHQTPGEAELGKAANEIATGTSPEIEIADDIRSERTQTIERRSSSTGRGEDESKIADDKSDAGDSGKTLLESEQLQSNFANFSDICGVTESLENANKDHPSKTGAHSSTERKAGEPSQHVVRELVEIRKNDHGKNYENEMHTSATSTSLSSSDSDTIKAEDSPEREVPNVVEFESHDMHDVTEEKVDKDTCVGENVCEIEENGAAGGSVEESKSASSISSLEGFDEPSNSKKPVKHHIVQEVITTLYSYRVESPKPMQPKAVKSSLIKKSRSLDDDDLMIQEMSDNSSAGDLTDNQPLVSEAESEAESSETLEVDKTDPRILSITTIPLDSPEADSIQSQEFASSKKAEGTNEEGQDFKSKRAKKRNALEAHFMPQFLNPRYLDSIKEECSDMSDAEKKSNSGDLSQPHSPTGRDPENDVFPESPTIAKKADAIFPKSNLDFSHKHKPVSHLRAPKTGVIREEPPCVVVEAKIVEQESIEESCSTWITDKIQESGAAETVYLDSASSSSSDLMDLDYTQGNDADVEDLTEDTDVQIKTPTIEVDGEGIFSDSSAHISEEQQNILPPEQREENIPSPPPVVPKIPQNSQVIEKPPESCDHRQFYEQSASEGHVAPDENALENNSTEVVNHSVEFESSTSECTQVTTSFKIGELCSDNMFGSLVSPLISDKENVNKFDSVGSDAAPGGSGSGSIKELSRQDSSGSHGSGQSQSTVHSQCTAINKDSLTHSDVADIADVGSCVSGSFHEDQIQSLRQLCIEVLASMPYGKVVLEELAFVAQSLSHLTEQHQEKKLSEEAAEMPYPLPDLPHIKDLEVTTSGNKPTKVKLVPVPPPKSESPVPPPVPELPKEDSWLGVPTKKDPNILVCLSPSQRNYMKETNTFPARSADSLLDMHQKFVERRGYHELTAEQVNAVHHKKAEHVVSSATQLRNSVTPPPVPPPPLSQAFTQSEPVATSSGDGDDRNNHRLLAIIRDSKQSSSENSPRKIEQEAKPAPVSVSRAQCSDQETQTAKGEATTTPAPATSSTKEDKLSEDSGQGKNNSSMSQENFDRENFFKSWHSEDPIQTDFKRFSNIETTPKYCGQIMQTMPKRYSNIETSSYESRKRVENGQVIYDYCDSKQEKFSDYKDKEKDGLANAKSEIMSDAKLDKIFGTTASSPAGQSSEFSQAIKNSKSNNEKKSSTPNDFSYDEFRQRAKETAKNAKNEFFKREHLLKDFEDIEKILTDDMFTMGKVEENRRESKADMWAELEKKVINQDHQKEEKSEKKHYENWDFTNKSKAPNDLGKSKQVFQQEHKEHKKETRSYEIPIRIETKKTDAFEELDRKMRQTERQHSFEIPRQNDKTTDPWDRFDKLKRQYSLQNDQQQKTKPKTHEIPIKIEDNSKRWEEFETKLKQQKSEQTSEQKVINIPVKIEKSKQTNYNESQKSNERAIPVKVEGKQRPASTTFFDQYSSSANSSFFKEHKLTEKRLSSHNLDEWMKYADLGASSENITKPFMKEMEIVCHGKRGNIRAPRLTASTSNLNTVGWSQNSPKSPVTPLSPPRRPRYNSYHSSIDQTPITQYVSPHYVRQCSLPREIHHNQAEYIKQKEHELQTEFDRLEHDRRKLIEEMDRMHTSHQLRKDLYQHRSCKLPTLSEEEAFRQQMHDEWMSKVAEREERRLHKIIKISKPNDDLASGAPEKPVRKSSSSIDISDEFLKRVKERRSKLQMPSDSDWESGAESQPPPRPAEPDYEPEPSVKVIEGQKEADLRHLPKHLREFAELASKVQEEHSKETSTYKTSSTMSKKEDYLQVPGSTSQRPKLATILRHKATSQGSAAAVTRHKKQTRFALSPNRRSWSESDLLKEIDSALSLAKGFLYGREPQPTMIAPKFKAKAPGPGVWTPGTKSENTKTLKESKSEKKCSSGPAQSSPTPPPPPPLPVWSPEPSPTFGRKEFRPIKFESPVLQRRYVRTESTPVAPPWSYNNSQPFLGYQSSSCSNINSVGTEKRSYSSTSDIPQKVKDNSLAKGASYTEAERPKIPKDNSPGILRPNEVIFSVKHEYLSEPETENDRPKKMAQLGRRQFEGIGPTTRDGMPIVLRSEVKENNQHQWYKRMYNTLHKAKDGDEYVTISYKTRRGRYPYKSNGYMSEPEPNYDSDYSTMKYSTLDRRRAPSTGTFQDERNYGTMPNPVKAGSGSYKNQPGRIENYVPGRSSVSEKEKKEWWDEVMDIFNGHLEQQKLSNNYTEGYLSRALKEQGYESDSNLVFRRREESQYAPLSPVEQKQAYRSVQAGGEPPLQGFRKPAPEKPKDDKDIEYYPITPTLTKIRVHNKSLVPQPQKEIICYPITHTSITRPLDLFAPFPKNVISFVPLNPPPPPPSRHSSRINTALKVFSEVKETKKTGPAGRHEACFQSDYYQRDGPSNKYGTVTIRKQTKREPLVRSKSAGPICSTKTMSASIKEETSQSCGSRVSRKQQSYRVSSSSPGRPASKTDLRKSSPSPVAFGRSISKERTFAEEKKRLEETLPLSRRSFTASTNILRDPSLKSPDEVKIAVRRYAQPLMRSKSAPKKLSTYAPVVRSSSYLSASARKNTAFPGKKEEKSLRMTVSLTSKGRDANLSQRSSTRTPGLVKSNLHSSSVVEKRTPKQMTKTSSTVSLARTSSTFSVDSNGSKKRTSTKKPKTIVKSTSRDERTVPVTLHGPYKPVTLRDICPSRSESNVLQKVQQSVDLIQPERIAESIEKEIQRDISDAILQHKDSVRSDKFFQNLFLRDSSPMPSLDSSVHQHATSVQEKTRYWDELASRSEPLSRRSCAYLSQRRPVSDSKFLSLESKRFHQSRSLSPTYRKRSPRGQVQEKVTKFDSYYQLTDEESEFEEPGRAEEMIYKFEQRSSSEPRTRPPVTPITNGSRSTSPILHDRDYDYPRVFTPTREVRSPSRRRIESFRENRQLDGSKKVIRASSLSSADERSRRSLYECSEHSHSTSSLNFIERHAPHCRFRNSDRFIDLNRFYCNLERVGQLERATSSTDLRPIRKDGDIIDFDEWRKIRAHEKAEKELNYLVGKLKQDQREKDFLFRPKDIEDVKWREVSDSGLRSKEKSVEDLRESFERKIHEDGLDEAKKFEIEAEKDTYKPFWRGTSVADSASNMVVKYGRDGSRSLDRRLCLSNRLMSTLSKEQVNKIKTQLSEIYSGPPNGVPKEKSEISEDYIITVDEQNRGKIGSLKVRCNSTMSKEDLLGPVLKKKEMQIAAAKAESMVTHSLPPRPPMQSKSFERISKQVSRYETELSEVEKRKLSQSLSREIHDKVIERRHRGNSPVLLARETRGAVAAEAAKKTLPEPPPPPPQEYYSIDYSRSEMQKNERGSGEEKVCEKRSLRIRRSSVGETESNGSDMSKTTVIYKEKPDDGIQTKIKYFEEKKEEEPPKTIYHAREYSSPDEEEILKAIEEKMKAKEREVNEKAEKAMIRHQELSSSASDFKELFGERESSRVNFPLPRPPPPPDEDYQCKAITNVRRSSLTLSDRTSSCESIYRSRSVSPRMERVTRCILNRVRTGDVKKIADKFESLNESTRSTFFELGPLRKIRSDPELNKTKRNPHKITIRDHEVGDVSWITHKFEVKNSASRGRSRTRKVISPIQRVPIRKEDRLMPHIDIISKTAALKHEIAKSKSPSPIMQQPVHTGEVERIRCKFESPDRGSLLGQMYTSSPDISELKDISTYLTGSWIAHKYPKPRDNARSPIEPEKGPESEIVKRKQTHRSLSTSPPRSKTLVTSILKPYYDIFADQKFDPLIHRPKCRYVPDKVDELWKKVQNGFRKPNAVKFEENDVVPPSPPTKGVPLYENGHSQESPHRYFETDVNIHYKTPIRYEYKEAIPEEELARKQAETMKKLYQEERRRKYLQELQDMNSRRHTDNFTPTQKSPIPLNRYDDFNANISPKSPGSVTYPRTVARALYNFQGQTARELTFKKGDVIYIRRQIDKNWYEGEHNAMIGLLPANYVEVISKDGVRQPPKKPSEGQARAKFNFQAQSAIELSLNKGELVTLTRRVDENWFEGKIANRKGIFPVSYVEVLTDIGAEEYSPTHIKPVGAPASHSLITYPNTPSLDTLRTNLNNEFNSITGGLPANGVLRETKSTHKTEVLHVDTNSEPIAYRALYKYRPQNNDELELQEGDVVYVLEKCDDGWYVGTSQRTGYFGTFPGNYVERA